jgi:hypothetical protein
MKNSNPKSAGGSGRFALALAGCAVLTVGGLLCGCGGEQRAPLYSMRMERVKATLFADQKLQELVNLPQPPPGTPQADNWDLLLRASEDLQAKKTEEARQGLKTLLANTNLETRVQLWAWAALRGLGERPDPSVADKIKGMVLEVPGGANVDTLAVYADSSIRFIPNGSEVVQVLEKPSKPVADSLKKLFTIGESLLASAPITTNRPQLLIKEKRLTLLTFGGNHTISEAGPRGGKWKLPEEIAGAMEQLPLAITQETVKPKTGAAPGATP